MYESLDPDLICHQGCKHTAMTTRMLQPTTLFQPWEWHNYK